MDRAIYTYWEIKALATLKMLKRYLCIDMRQHSADGYLNQSTVFCSARRTIPAGGLAFPERDVPIIGSFGLVITSLEEPLRFDRATSCRNGSMCGFLDKVQKVDLQNVKKWCYENSSTRKLVDRIFVDPKSWPRTHFSIRTNLFGPNLTHFSITINLFGPNLT
jgi:hypothetical protein